MIDFKLKIRDKISILDEKLKIGKYIIVGRQWCRKKGIIYELKPEPTTAAEFYRVFLKDKKINKVDNNKWIVKIKGSQFKQYYSRKVEDIGFVQW